MLSLWATIKRNKNITKTDNLFENLINKTKEVFNNQENFLNQGPEKLFEHFSDKICDTKVFNILYEKNHNLVQFAHEFNSKHYLIKNTIKNFQQELIVESNENFSIWMSSNTDKTNLYDFQVNIYSVLNNSDNITKTYYQIKLRNTEDIPNILKIVKNCNRYLQDDTTNLIIDLSNLPLESYDSFLGFILQYYPNLYDYILNHRLIFLNNTQNIYITQDPIIFYITEHSDNILYLTN